MILEESDGAEGRVPHFRCSCGSPNRRTTHKMNDLAQVGLCFRMKAIAEWGATLLTIADKATDISAKLGPHLPMVAGLIEEAERYF